MDNQHDDTAPHTDTPWTLTRPCGHPGCDNPVGGPGYLDRKGHQDTVYCRGPDGDQPRHYARYNAPRRETGLPTNSLATRPGIAVSKRARILERDNYTCVMCHRADVPLDVGHLISRAEGQRAGLSDLELEDDENMVAACGPCNSGMGDNPVSLRFAIAVLRVRLSAQRRRAGGQL